MVFIIAIVGFFFCPFALFLCDDFEVGLTFTAIGVMFWWIAISSYIQEEKKKQAKAQKKSAYRKRNEDNFLNNYGYIDNSAFGSIQSFTNHDENSK